MKDIARADIKPAFAERNIPVALATDANYLPYVAVTINSLVANTKSGNLDVLVFHAGIGESSREDFLKGVRKDERVSVRFVDIGDEVKETAAGRFVQKTHLSVTTLFRLFMPRVLAAYERILYLDVDLIVCQDISELYDADLAGCLFGAVRDYGMADYVRRKPDLREFAGKYGFSEWDGYFNAGVMLMDLAALRSADLLDRLLPVAVEAAKFCCDQDALNYICKGRIRYLDPKWNVQALPASYEEQLKAAGGHAGIIHFVGGKKPWKYPSQLCAHLWWRYVDERDATRFKAAEMHAAVLKDYVRIARFIHNGECALDLAPMHPSSAKVLSEKSLADNVVSVAELSGDALKNFPDCHFDVVAVSALADGVTRQSELMKVMPELQRVLMPAGRLLLLVQDSLAALCAKKVGEYLIPEPSIKGAGIPNTTLQVYMRNPLVGRGVPYRETSWVVPEAPEYNMLAFARDYLNPWLIRGIVSGCGCARLSNPEAMATVRDEILATYPADSVDYGAALCGKIYAAASDMTEKFLPRVEKYCAISHPKPHQLRWQISNAFALAAHAQKFGNFDIAEQWYAYAAEGDVCAFSPTLGTKVMDAFWQLAQMALDKGDVAKALALLRRSFARADEILHADWLNVVGDPDCPVPIAYDEIALVCQKAARAAGMVNVLSRHPDRIEQARAMARSNAERYADVQERLKKAQTDIKALKDEIAALKKGRAK